MSGMSQTLGSMVREARKAQGLTQEEVGDKVGRSRHWLIQIEKDEWYGGKDVRPEPASLRKLAGVLNLDAEVVLAAAGVGDGSSGAATTLWTSSDNRQMLEVSGLTEAQLRLVEQLVRELKLGNAL